MEQIAGNSIYLFDPMPYYKNNFRLNFLYKNGQNIKRNCGKNWDADTI